MNQKQPHQPPTSDEMTQFVLLKNGKMIPCTAAQKASLGMAILTSPDFKQKIRLGGVDFRLEDIESDPNKIYAYRQQGLPLKDKP